jgi:hypothetical protein
MAELLGVELDEALPEQWRAEAGIASGQPIESTLYEEGSWSSPFSDAELAREVEVVVGQVLTASPLLAD